MKKASQTIASSILVGAKPTKEHLRSKDRNTVSTIILLHFSAKPMIPLWLGGVDEKNPICTVFAQIIEIKRFKWCRRHLHQIFDLTRKIV